MSTLARRWYSILLRGFPRDFQRQFAAEILEVLDQQRRKDRGGTISFHLVATIDLLRSMCREWRSDLLRPLGWILIVAALGNLGYDFVHPELSMGYLAWGLTVLALWLGYLLSMPPARRRPV